MPQEALTIGIIGGSEMLGLAMSEALLNSGLVPAERFWISNRSGASVASSHYSGINVTVDNQALVDACDVVVLCIPPGKLQSLSITSADTLFISVMAGVSIEQVQKITHSERVIRAMSSPAAASGLAYSPWVASPEVSTADREIVTGVLEACGVTDEMEAEAQIELFTAMTGPVPGFVAYFAQCMADYATERGITPEVADRATRQLFLAAGRMMSEGIKSPADHVQQMIDYDGTTAAGLDSMRHSSLKADIAKGLDAALEKTRTF